MNSVCQKAVSGFGLVLSLSLTSCREDKLVNPNRPSYLTVLDETSVPRMQNR